MTKRYWIVALVLAGFAAGCPKQKFLAPPPPYRPKEEKSAEDIKPKRTDCAPTNPAKLPGAVPEAQRRKVESLNLAAMANGMLQQAASKKHKKRETLIENAVKKLNTALLADPYNVEATYTLAAVQSMVGRTQCTVNLLKRMLELYKLDSYKAAVDEKINRLLGRGQFRGKLDTRFDKVRAKASYRQLARKFPTH